VTLNDGTINVGSDPLADNIRNDGLIINNGGSLIVGGRIYGTGEIVQCPAQRPLPTRPPSTLAASPLTAGRRRPRGRFWSAGTPARPASLSHRWHARREQRRARHRNAGSLTSGSGTGHMMVSNATVTAASIIMGSATVFRRHDHRERRRRDRAGGFR